MRKWRKELHTYDPATTTDAHDKLSESGVQTGATESTLDESRRASISEEEEEVVKEESPQLEEEESIDLNDASSFCLESIEEMLNKGNQSNK